MELRPIKHAMRPHYAAILAAAASAMLLTGCGNDGEVATEGVIANPNPPTTDIVEIAGGETFNPDLTDTLPTLEGEAVPAETTATEPVLMGLVPPESTCTVEPDDTEVMLAGDVIYSPDFTEVNADVRTEADRFADALKAGFAREGIALSPETEPLDTFNGVQFICPYADRERKVMAVFYDSTASTFDGYSLDGYLSAFLTDEDARAWGICRTAGYLQEEYRCAFIDLASGQDLTEELFAEIAQDVKNLEGSYESDTASDGAV